MGRNRTLAASKSAALRSSPGTCWPLGSKWSSRARIAKSTSKMAFLVTRPMSMTTPITENIDKVELKTIKASTTPMSVRGSAVIRASGCKKLLNWLARIM